MKNISDKIHENPFKYRMSLQKELSRSLDDRLFCDVMTLGKVLNNDLYYNIDFVIKFNLNLE